MFDFLFQHIQRVLQKDGTGRTYSCMAPVVGLPSWRLGDRARKIRKEFKVILGYVAVGGQFGYARTCLKNKTNKAK